MEEKIYNPKIYDDEDLRRKCGVYQIRNAIDNKIYVGSSKNLYSRKESHFYNLSKNKHINQHLQNAYNKYGKENFIFEIIEFCNTDEQIIFEQYWLDKLNVCSNGYNIQPKAGKIIVTEETRKKLRGRTPWNKGKRGIYSEETLLKMKDNHDDISGIKNPFYGKHHTQEFKDKMMKERGHMVLCIETKVVYFSLREAERETKIARTNITRACKGKIKTAGGYTWKFIDKIE